MNQTWEENGLTSLLHAELCNGVAEKFLVTLPPTFFMVFKTPQELKDYINGQSSVPFPVKLPHLQDCQRPNDTNTISEAAFRMATGLSIMMLILLLLASFIPSAFLISMTSGYQLSYQVGASPLTFELVLLPIGVPLFALVFSLVLVATKWMVVGSYRSTHMATPSISYLQWWFMDRAMHLWETWIGRFLIGTKFATIFYRLMGANIHPSARVSAFIREFDLVTIGQGASVTYPIRCRKFGRWGRGADGPSLRLRPILIGKGCNIKGMVSPGAEIGNGASVEPMSVVPEGAQIPYNVVARGNPACGRGKTAAVSIEWFPEVVLEASKLLWLFAELYIFYAALATSWNLASDIVPSSFRYQALLQVVLMGFVSVALLIFISLLLKWILIGRRVGGSSSTTWTRVVDLCVNFHFRASIFFPYSITGGSRLWNIVLKLHGLDIDLYSYVVDPLSFLPSQVDNIRIFRSFVSAAPSFETTGQEKIEIVESSVAAQVSIASGVKVVRSTLRPMVRLEESIYNSNPVPVSRQPGVWLLELLYACTAPFLAATLVPAFELIQVSQSWPAWTIPFLIVLVLLLQCFLWTSCLRLLQPLANWLHFNAPQWLSHPIYTLYLNHTWNCSNYCFWYLLWGTPFVTPLLRFMGARIQDRLWYNGSSLNDFACLTIADRTVMDTCAVSSHKQVFGRLDLTQTRVGGLLHPGTYAQGSTVLESDKEYGPCRNFTTAGISEEGKTPHDPSGITMPEDDFDV